MAPTAPQSAALPYRFDESGALQILLVTTRRSKRWAVPKGKVKSGMLPHISAAREAYEEAGVVGQVQSRPCGIYTHHKTLADGRVHEIAIRLFPLLVTSEMRVWPEMADRDRAWLPAREALDRIRYESLRVVVETFIAATATSEDTTDDVR